MNRTIAALIAILPVILAAPAWGAGSAPAKDSSKDSAGKDASPVNSPKGTFLKLDPMAAPLPPGDKGRKQMMLSLQLEVAQANIEKVNILIPRIRDAFIRDLFARPVGTPLGWDPGDMETVRARLVSQANKVAGEGVIFDVLIVQAVRIGGV
jgi:hypothetical protein